MMWSKFLSRKFLLALAGLITAILVGLGYDVDPALISELAIAIAGLYIIVEGIIDALKVRK